MNRPIGSTIPPGRLDSPPEHVHGLRAQERDRLVISVVKTAGVDRVLSRYGDDQWQFATGPTNRSAADRSLDFLRVPEPFRKVMKTMVYRYLLEGRGIRRRPSVGSLVGLFNYAMPFLRHLTDVGIQRLADVTPLVCKLYVDACKAERTSQRGGSLAAGTLGQRFVAVEALCELSQYTSDPIPCDPWPGTSAWIMAGTAARKGPGRSSSNRTPLMPDQVFVDLFNAAKDLVDRGDRLLDLRDGLVPLEEQCQGKHRGTLRNVKTRYLQRLGWTRGLKALICELNDLRMACYIVVASLSGCRNHELADLRSGCWHQTEDDEGETYWWMRSRSTKTDAGDTEWMIPDAAVAALLVLQRWAMPYQVQLSEEVGARRAADPADPQIAEAERHLGALFVGVNAKTGSHVRTLSRTSWGLLLKAFTKKHRIQWNVSSHQFRRKFANYAARSQFGDLRYLKEHFKHWSMDMTLGYALNDSQEMALFIEIQEEFDDIKQGVADSWLDPGEPLAGGYGRGLVTWRGSDAVTIFKDRKTMVRSIAESTAIRSNGHAWCTAHDNRCVGNGVVEAAHCTGCDNAVIGKVHAHVYQGMYDHLQEVLVCDDIGEGGQARVRRDLQRCRDVLTTLGYRPPEPRT